MSDTGFRTGKERPREMIRSFFVMTISSPDLLEGGLARLAALALILLLAAPARGEDTSVDPLRQWPSWRGPLGTGVAPHASPPLHFGEEQNIRWKIPLPGKGHASPVVWKDHVFLLTAIPTGDPVPPRPDPAPGAHDNLPVTYRQKFSALAVSRTDGRLLWLTTLHEALPHEGAHSTATLASASPVTDGDHVFAFFGSYGLYCLDTLGRTQWEKSFGRMQSLHGHGEGSSPVLHGDTLVVNWDHEGPSFLVALDKRTGEQLWKMERDEATSWASPIIATIDGKPQVIVSGTTRIRGYDLETGKVIWECGGLSSNVVATPVFGGGLLFAGSSYDFMNLMAIRLEGARGDLTRTDRVIWTRRRGTSYVPSPLLYGDSLYFLRHYQGILSRVEATTGKDVHSPLRLPGVDDIYASPVGAAERIYITDRDGVTMVVGHEGQAKILARNTLSDSFSATPALVGHDLILRGEKSLYCIAQE